MPFIVGMGSLIPEGVSGASYSVDATSGKPIPQNLTEFNALMTEAGVSGGPSHAWLIGKQKHAKRALATAISTAADTITFPSHGWTNGDGPFIYDVTVTPIGGLTDGGLYYVNVIDANTIKLATSQADALAGTTIDLTSTGSGDHFLYPFFEDIIAGTKRLLDTSGGSPAAGVTCQVARSGWASTFMRFTSGTGALFANSSFSNVNANPYLLILRAAIDSTGGTRTVARMGDVFDDDTTIEVTATPRMQVGEGFGAPRRLGSTDPVAGADVITFALYIDPGSRRACMAYTTLEKIDSAYGGVYANGTTLTIGGDNTQTWYPPTMEVLDAWLFTGANAQKTMPEMRALMAKLDGIALASYPKFSWNMIKTSAGASYDAGARTTQTWSADVYVETTLGYTGDTWALGLGADDPDQDYATIDFAVLNDSGAMFAYENGVGTNLGITPAIGEVWRVAREGTAMKIYKNGVVVHTFTGTSSGAIHVDSAIRIQGSAIRSIRVVAAGVEQDITWTNIVNAAVY